LLLLCVIVGGRLWTAHEFTHARPHLPEIRPFIYPLPNKPPFLSETLALAAAQKALSRVVPDAPVWIPIKIGDWNSTEHDRTRGVYLFRDWKDITADESTRDSYLFRDRVTSPDAGFVLFTSTQHTNMVWAVSIQLNGNHLEGMILEDKQ
jgi:hypothetical protein